METIYKSEQHQKYLRVASFVFLMVYALLYVILGRTLLEIDELTTAVLMIAGIIPFILMANEWTGRNINPFLLFIFSAIMVFGKIMYLLIMDPVATPDGVRYYNQIAQYQDNFKGFLDFFWFQITNNHVLASSYATFGVVYLPFYMLFNTGSSYLILIFNIICLIFIAYFTYLNTKEIYVHEIKHNKTFLSLIVAGVLISPTLMYWSSTFSKDIFGILMTMVALYFLLKKRYILFLITLLMATTIRPYSIAIIAIYYCLYKGSKKLMWLGIIGSIAVVGYYTGTTGVFNTFNTLAYLIASPNPLSLENWEGFFLFEVEILFILGMLALSLYVFINNKESRKFYFLVLGGVFIYSCVMTLVGYGVIDARDLEYGVGVVGDDITRKKAPIIILYYIVISYTLIKLRTKIRW